MDETSVLELLSQLCHHSLKKQPTTNLLKPSVPHSVNHRRIKLHAYNALFATLKGPHSAAHSQTDGQRESRYSLSVIDQLYSAVFNLRQSKQYDNANKLEYLVDTLAKVENTEARNAICKLFLCLKGSGSKDGDLLVGGGFGKVPIVYPDEKLPNLLPRDTLCYGDTRLYTANIHSWFLYYPAGTFNMTPMQHDIPGSDTALPKSIFSMPPGSGLQAANLFTVDDKRKSMQKPAINTLFGSLLQSRVHDVNVCLDIPELTEGRMPHIHVPKAKGHHEDEDEGFAEKLSHTGSVEEGSSPCDSGVWATDDADQYKEDVWDKALKLVPSKHYVWENVGCVPQVTENPYATEAGPLVFDQILKAFTHTLAILQPDHAIPLRQEISMIQLMEDVKKLLLALPSQTFMYDSDAEKFVFVPGTCISGMSSEGLRNAVADLVDCGNCYRLLRLFAKPPIMDYRYNAGLVFQAFAGALRDYLQLYHAAVLSLPLQKTLSHIRYLMHDILDQIQFIADLCKCKERCPNLPAPNATVLRPDDFPTGIKLLTYLYEVTMEAASSRFCPILLGFLKASSKPYLTCVCEWVFVGTCKDVYGEFMIQADQLYLNYRDQRYWTQGYSLAAPEEQSSTPVFMEKLANDIFVCGKTINLLRLCQDRHFLFTTDQDLPSVEITFSSRELVSKETQASIYLSRMLAVSHQHQRTQILQAERERKAKEELVMQARRLAQEEAERYEEKVRQARLLQEEKKRKLLDSLRDQMNKDLRRRAAERENEVEEDAERLRTVMRIEAVGSVVDERLERMAREELVAYYEQLSAQAALREEKALWRVRRLRLNDKRAEFFQSDEAILRNQLKEWAFGGMPGRSSSEATSNTDLDLSEASPTLQEEAPAEPDGKAISVSSIKSDPHFDLPMTSGITEEPDDEKPRSKWDLMPSNLPKDMPSWARPNPSLKRKATLCDPLSMTGSSEIVDNQAVSSVMTQAAANSENTAAPESGNDMKIDRKMLIADLSEEQLKVQSILLKRGVNIGPDIDLLQENQPPVKSSVKLVQGQHTGMESTNGDDSYKSTVRIQEAMRAGTESGSTEEVIHIKMVADHHASEETTQEDLPRQHIQLVHHRSATQQSEEVPQEAKVIQMIQGKHVSDRSSQDDLTSKPHLKFLLGQYANKESKPAEMRVARANVHGHVSEVSAQNNGFAAPKQGRSTSMHATKESTVYDMDYYGFQVKPSRRRKVQGQEVNQQSEEVVFKPGIKMQRTHVSMETEQVDVDQARLQKFKLQNAVGHSSDSSVEKLLYGGRFGVVGAITEEEGEEVNAQIKIDLVSNIFLEPYQDSWPFSDVPAPFKLLVTDADACEIVSPCDVYRKRLGGDCELLQYVSLPAMLRRCVAAPLEAQIHLVNECIINYFMVDLKLKQHFEALRHYLFMEDGEFAHSLSSHLFEKLASCRSTAAVFNPMFLNSALGKAVQASLYSQSANADHLSFILKFQPRTMNQNLDALDCLLLTYQVDWPLNTIITEECLMKYAAVFSFLLQLKRTAWTLQDVWQRMKRDAVVNNARCSQQLRSLHLFRHEMQHLVQVMQSYITNQVIQGTWHHFMASLEKEACSIDTLRLCHARYLDDCLARSLVDKRAEPVLKIIRNIFSLSLKFRTQLMSHSWSHDTVTGELTHPMYEQMCDTYKSFNEYSRFLYKLVSKLVKKRYQSHLDELLLRLKFN